MKMTRALPAILLSGMLLATYGLQAISQDAAVHLPEGLEMDRPGPKSAAEQQIQKNILGFQAELKAAALAKDRSKIESLFAPDATVTLATGQVTDKQGRIEQILGPGWQMVSLLGIFIPAKDSPGA